jgi:hypothetical protein
MPLLMFSYRQLFVIHLTSALEVCHQKDKFMGDFRNKMKQVQTQPFNEWKTCVVFLIVLKPPTTTFEPKSHSLVQRLKNIREAIRWNESKLAIMLRISSIDERIQSSTPTKLVVFSVMDFMQEKRWLAIKCTTRMRI